MNNGNGFDRYLIDDYGIECPESVDRRTVSESNSYKTLVNNSDPNLNGLYHILDFNSDGTFDRKLVIEDNLSINSWSI